MECREVNNELKCIQKILLSNKICWRSQFSVNSVYRELNDNLNKIDLKENEFFFLIDFKRKVDRIQTLDRDKLEVLIEELKNRMIFLINQKNKKTNIDTVHSVRKNKLRKHSVRK